MEKIILIFFILILKCGSAQYMDTLHAVLKGRASIDARLESRYSFINNEIIGVTGFRLGAAFQRKLRIGGGLSWLKTNFSQTFHSSDTTELIKSSVKYLKFGYTCLYADFVFYKTKRWQLSVPIQVGAGLTWFQPKINYNLYGPDAKYFLLLYEPGITVQFKVFKWFGLGADVAYRFAMTNRKIAPNLNSPTYSFKILFWFDELYYMAFPNSKLTQKYGPATW
jgi:hypothetical protein